MRIWRKTQKAEKPDMATLLRIVVTEVLLDLRRNPVTVKHDIRRYIPRPSQATLIVSNGMGQEYRHTIDMSWKNTFPVSVPLSFVTGREEDIKLPPIGFRFNLEYNPQDRCG